MKQSASFKAVSFRCLRLAIFLAASSWSASAANIAVSMVSGNRFFPPDITVNAGDTVTWMNQDSVFHDTVSGTNRVPSGLWSSGLLAPGGIFSFTFNVPAGRYAYYCTPHVFLGMVGSVTVVAPNTPPTVSITSPANGASFTAGTTILIQA